MELYGRNLNVFSNQEERTYYNTKIYKKKKKGSNIAIHAWLNVHSIDFNNAHVIDKGNFPVKKPLESSQVFFVLILIFSTSHFLPYIFLFSIGPLQDPVTWYGINYAGTQVT